VGFQIIPKGPAKEIISNSPTWAKVNTQSTAHVPRAEQAHKPLSSTDDDVLATTYKLQISCQPQIFAICRVTWNFYFPFLLTYKDFKVENEIKQDKIISILSN